MKEKGSIRMVEKRKIGLAWTLRATIEASSPQYTYGDSLGGRGLQPIA